MHGAKLFLTVAGCVILLSSSQASFSQTNDQRLADAINEIALLKRVVAEQDRRIGQLERAVSELQLGANSMPQGPATSARPTPSTQANPWKTRAAWSRVKEGMSRAQVAAILGQPTSVDTVSEYQTLFYRGEVPGSGSVTGTIKLMDDRVWQVNVPVF